MLYKRNCSGRCVFDYRREVQKHNTGVKDEILSTSKSVTALDVAGSSFTRCWVRVGKEGEWCI